MNSISFGKALVCVPFFVLLTSLSAYAGETTASENAAFEAIGKIYSDLAKTTCKTNLASKEKEKVFSKLKLVDSALYVACFITAKTAVEDCHAKLVAIAKDQIGTNDKKRVNTMLEKSYAFCDSYADVVSNVIVEMVLDDVTKNKISVDEATKKLMNQATK
ncbi:MAG: hypothetical protein IPJ84_06905 [Bdellovibrionales bacterium]|nr:hypothetical protein [Bdellovibrionales bacterium]